MAVGVITDVLSHAPAIEIGTHWTIVSGAVGFVLASTVRTFESVKHHLPDKVVLMLVKEDPRGGKSRKKSR